jgi:hypothetical protein
VYIYDIRQKIHADLLYLVARLVMDLYSD